MFKKEQANEMLWNRKPQWRQCVDLTDRQQTYKTSRTNKFVGGATGFVFVTLKTFHLLSKRLLQFKMTRINDILHRHNKCIVCTGNCAETLVGRVG